MSEAELMYKMELLYTRRKEYSNNLDVLLKTQDRLNDLNYKLRLKFGRWYHEYKRAEIDNLIAEHILLEN